MIDYKTISLTLLLSIFTFTSSTAIDCFEDFNADFVDCGDVEGWMTKTAIIIIIDCQNEAIGDFEDCID